MRSRKNRIERKVQRYEKTVFGRFRFKQGTD